MQSTRSINPVRSARPQAALEPDLRINCSGYDWADGYKLYKYMQNLIYYESYTKTAAEF